MDFVDWTKMISLRLISFTGVWTAIVNSAVITYMNASFNYVYYTDTGNKT